MSQVVGFVLAGLSALCNGSFAALRKVEAVRHVSVTDIQFNLYLSLGVFLSSMVALLFIPAAGKDIGICWQGVLAGSLLAIAGLFSFLAVSALGLSVAQGIWGGTSILVSFGWGAFGPAGVKGTVDHAWGSALSIILILGGVVGIIRSFGMSSDERSTEVRASSALGFARGILFALITGFAGGSILVPLSYAPESLQEIAFLPSFGIGVFLLALVFERGEAYYCDRAEDYDPLNRISVGVPFHLNAAVVYGILSGIIWNLGNVCSIYAMKSGLSYGVAYPILQCALVFSGLWGILFFKEITGRKAIVWFTLSAGTVIIGAFLLGLFGPKKVDS